MNQFFCLLKVSTASQIHLGSSNQYQLKFRPLRPHVTSGTAGEQSPEQVARGWACVTEAPRSLFPFQCCIFDVTNKKLIVPL